MRNCRLFSRFGAAFLVLAGCAGNAQADVKFSCPAQLTALQRGVPNYLRTLGIPAAQVAQTVNARSGELILALTTPPTDTRTLDLFMRPQYAISPERVRLPAAQNGKMRVLNTVSRKEIMLALLQHGRVTTFSGDACSVESLSDRVGLRQNIVAWAEQLNWDWPNGGPARWNTKYWNRGTPNPGVSLHAAVMDAFRHQEKYAMGCYTATKLVIVQGTLDYYSRVKHDPVRTRRVEKALLADGDPLVGIEPGSMWSFEKDYDAADMAHKGKLLKLSSAVAAGNFIPGDWGYILNTDPVSEQKTGYEGSNAIYLGRNRFDDYYDDNDHHYTYEQKLDEVYQWRNGVFSRQRDAKKIQRLTPEQQALLSSTPDAGGLQLDVRAVPRSF
jgi:hypothetical protein